MKPLNKILILVIILLHWSCQRDQIIPDSYKLDCSKYPVSGDYKFPDQGTNDGEKSFLNVTGNPDYQIPANVLDTISTEGLIKTCLNYPYFTSIFLSSCHDVQGSFKHYMENFNGFITLYKRNDVSFKLLERYICCEWEDKNYTLPLTDGNKYIHYFIEIMLAQDEIIQQLDDQNRKILFTKALDIYETHLQENDKAFSVFSLLILGKIMVFDEFQPFMSEYNKNDHIKWFFESGSYCCYNNFSVFKAIEENARLYN